MWHYLWARAYCWSVSMTIAGQWVKSVLIPPTHPLSPIAVHGNFLKYFPEACSDWLTVGDSPLLTGWAVPTVLCQPQLDWQGAAAALTSVTKNYGETLHRMVLFLYFRWLVNGSKRCEWPLHSLSYMYLHLKHQFKCLALCLAHYKRLKVFA